MLILLIGGRRVHDLSLLHIGPGDMLLADDEVLFQPRFGSKTDGKGKGGRFVQPKMGFRRNSTSWALSVPDVVKSYLRITKEHRGATTSLFVSDAVPGKPASVVLLRRWIRSLLEEAGIAASAGSTRSAVATASGLAGCSLRDIMRNGNWRSHAVVRRHYFRPDAAATL